MFKNQSKRIHKFFWLFIYVCIGPLLLCHTWLMWPYVFSAALVYGLFKYYDWMFEVEHGEDYYQVLGLLLGFVLGTIMIFMDVAATYCKPVADWLMQVMYWWLL